MNPYTKKWLNTKCAFMWHYLEKSKEGGEVHDVMKNQWSMFRGHGRASYGRKLHEAIEKAKMETR